MAIGTAAHELGHALGLPDLYDTDRFDGDFSEGIGEWGLMGTANYTSPLSPGHFSAWSKQRLGWVVLAELATVERRVTGPVVTSDTVFRIEPRGPNPRREYFLLENKQPVGADTANMLTGGDAGPKLGGLLIWHVDAARLVEALPFNRVNTGGIQGVRLIQADDEPDLNLSPDGVLSGVPEKAGMFRIPVSTTSGNYGKGGNVHLLVSAPDLDDTELIDQLLGLSSNLTDEQVDYLDFIANRNGRLDIGDFIVWYNEHRTGSAGSGKLSFDSVLARRRDSHRVARKPRTP